jgi:hypothetical protein
MKKQKKINWEYCECGCHGHEATVKGTHYWVFNDLGPKRDGNGSLFHLHRGHGFMGVKLGEFDGFETVDSYINTMQSGGIKC